MYSMYAMEAANKGILRLYLIKAMDRTNVLPVGWSCGGRCDDTMFTRRSHYPLEQRRAPISTSTSLAGPYYHFENARRAQNIALRYLVPSWACFWTKFCTFTVHVLHQCTVEDGQFVPLFIHTLDIHTLDIHTLDGSNGGIGRLPDRRNLTPCPQLMIWARASVTNCWGQPDQSTPRHHGCCCPWLVAKCLLRASS